MVVLAIIPVDFCWFGGCFSFCKQLQWDLVKSDYILVLLECILGLVALDLFLVIQHLLQAYQLFLVAYQQVSDCNLCFRNLSFSSYEWRWRSFLVEQILFIWSVWLYGVLFFNHFGCSELIFRKVWQYLFFLNILVCNLLFLIYISVSRNEILSFDISYSNLIDGCFVFNLFKTFSASVLQPFHIKIYCLWTGK